MAFWDKKPEHKEELIFISGLWVEEDRTTGESHLQGGMPRDIGDFKIPQGAILVIKENKDRKTPNSPQYKLYYRERS